SVGAPAAASPPRQKGDRGAAARPGAAHYSCAPLTVNVFGPLEPVRNVARTGWLDGDQNTPPLAGGSGADCRVVRSGPTGRRTGGRCRAGAPGVHHRSRAERQPVAGVGSARSDGEAGSGSGDKRSAPPAEPGGTRFAAGRAAPRPR